MVKQFLSQKKVQYEERDVSLNRTYAQELVNNTGQMGVPVTVYGKEIIVGFDRPRLEQLVVRIKAEEQPSFGAAVADASRITAQQGLPVKAGAYIGRVKPGSVAARIGLAAGDIVTKVNSQDILNAAEMQNALAGLQSNVRISVVFLRGDTLKKGETAV